MDPRIQSILSEETKHPLHQALFNHIEAKMKPARSRMQTYYGTWDAMTKVYLSVRDADKNDIEAVKQGLPSKVILPLSTSQILTGAAFGYMLLTQRPRFYEFDPTDDEDRKAREAGEILVERDMLASDYKKRLWQAILSLLVRGIAVEKDCWYEDYLYVPVQTTTPGNNYAGQPTSEPTVSMEVKRLLKKQGNQIRSISPYNVFTDPGWSIDEYRMGDFVGVDEEYSRTTLEGMETEGLVTGVKFIKDYQRGDLKTYERAAARFSFDVNSRGQNKPVVITEWIGKLNPAKIEVNGETLGEDSPAHNWLVWIANDQRVIRAEPMTYLHGQYPISIGMFLPDMHTSFVNSLPQQIGDLQELVSWLMNSRMAAVSRMVDQQMLVDPIGIDTTSVQNRQRVLIMKKEASGKDVRRFLQQIEVKDTTQGHVGDIQNLTAFTQFVSGINDNMMGQMNEGRRSATEARASMNGAASRMKMVYDIMWGMMYQPQANRLLINHRQMISPEEYAIVCGQEYMQHFETFKSSPEFLVRSYDYITYDGTMPSDKLFLAQQLQETLGMLLSNPMAAAAFNIDPAKLMKEIGTLRGYGQFGNFAFDQFPANLVTQLQQANGPASAPPQQKQISGKSQRKTA